MARLIVQYAVLFPCNVVISTYILCKKALLTRKWLLDEGDVTVILRNGKGLTGKLGFPGISGPICMLALLFILFSLFWTANSCSSPFIELRKGFSATYRAAQLMVK